MFSLERLHEYCEPEPNTGCWLWTKCANCWDQPLVGSRGKLRIASREVFFLKHGYLPPVVRHRCDQPLCVNPDHLLPGTQRDNMRDCLERGRWARARPTLRGRSRIAHRRAEIVAMRARGLSWRAIGRIVGAEHHVVQHCVTGYVERPR